MRVSIIILITITFFCLFKESHADCNNPLGKALGNLMVDAPAQFTGGTCTSLGGESCCAQSVHDQMGSYISGLVDYYTANSNYIPAVVTFVDDLIVNLEAKLEKVVSQSGIANEEESSDTQTTTQSDDGTWEPNLYDSENNKRVSKDEWSQMKANFPSYMQTCTQKLFDLESALLCAACSKDYEEFTFEETSYIPYLEHSSNSIEPNEKYSSMTLLTVDLVYTRGLNTACKNAENVFNFLSQKLEYAMTLIELTEFLKGHTGFEEEDYYADIDTRLNNAENYVSNNIYEQVGLKYLTLVVDDANNNPFGGLQGINVGLLVLINEFGFDLVEEVKAYSLDNPNIIDGTKTSRRLLAAGKDPMELIRKLAKGDLKGLYSEYMNYKMNEKDNLNNDAKNRILSNFDNYFIIYGLEGGYGINPTETGLAVSVPIVNHSILYSIMLPLIMLFAAMIFEQF